MAFPRDAILVPEDVSPPEGFQDRTSIEDTLWEIKNWQRTPLKGSKETETLGVDADTENVKRRLLMECGYDHMIDHLELAMLQVRAELWEFFKGKVPKIGTYFEDYSEKNKGWRSKLPTFRFEGDYVNAASDIHLKDRMNRLVQTNLPVPGTLQGTPKFFKLTKLMKLTGDDVELQELKGHLCIIHDELYFARNVILSCGCTPDAFLKHRCANRDHKSTSANLMLVWLMSMGEYPDSEAQHPDARKLVHSLGYVDFMKYFNTLLRLQRGIKCSIDRTSDEGSDASDASNEGSDYASEASEAGEASSASGADAILRAIVRPARGRTTPANYARLPESTMPPRLALKLSPCAAQEGAVAALGHVLEVIQGPPGTGKSTCIQRIVAALPHEALDLVLITAMQNKAIDVLVEKFEPLTANNPVTSRMDMVVIGSSHNANMGPTAQRFSLNALIELNAEYAKQVADFAKFEGSLEEKRALSVKLKEAREATVELILSNARIVFSTVTEIHKILTHAACKILRSRIKTVIVDEAGTVPEYAMCVVAAIGGVERLIILGDKNQLPPFSHLQDGRRLPGFLERAQGLIELAGHQVHFLSNQHRMQAALASFVSMQYYYNKLFGCAPPLPTPLYHSERITGLFWCENDGLESKPRGTSIVNEKEAEIILQIVTTLEDCVLSVKTVAIISFYKAQTERLEEKLEECAKELESPKGEQCAFVKAWRERRLRVQTVDSAQGSEAHLVIVSTVRSNNAQDLGFLDGPPNRLCVACSRAREGMIVVGNRATLRQLPALSMLLHPPKELTVHDMRPETRLWELSPPAPKQQIVRVTGMPRSREETLAHCRKVEDGFWG